MKSTFFSFDAIKTSQIVHIIHEEATQVINFVNVFFQKLKNEVAAIVAIKSKPRQKEKDA